jgi:hypothetical protein
MPAQTHYLYEAASRGGPAGPKEKSILDVPSAIREVTSKTQDQIEQETSFKWGSRAVACFNMVLRETNNRKIAMWFSQGEHYRSEAYEHAAQVNDNFLTQRRIRPAIERARREAIEFIK